MPPLDQLPQAYQAACGQIDELKTENAQLRVQLALLRKKLFGSGQSERLDRQQLLLELEQMEASLKETLGPTEAISYERPKATGPKRSSAEAVFAQLPVHETIVIEPEEVQAEPEAFERIGEETTFDGARQRADGAAPQG